MLNEIHGILQDNGIITCDRDVICYNYGEDIRNVMMRALKMPIGTRSFLIHQLDTLVKNQVYAEIAKFYG